MLRLLIILLLAAPLLAQQPSVADIEKGIHFIETHTFSDKENQELLELYKNLRVADVSDGMDMVGLPNTGLVSPDIQAEWFDRENLSHVFRGIAVTVRYVPTQRPDRPVGGQDFSEWEGQFYNNWSHEAFTKIIKPGTAIVIDDVEDKDIGSIGSNNILNWYRAGAVGVVTDAGARDTDEIEIQKVPLYLRKKGRGIRPGRNEIESINRPIVIGGVLVKPGDVVVADGDGVIIVPRHIAGEVARFAQTILDKDKASRRQLYESIGRPLDDTVR